MPTDKNPIDDADFDQQRRKLLQSAPIPLLWLFGKTGSGKSSIIRLLTGATEAEIGSGFRPHTKTSQQFSFPDDEMPIARFLDTRGIGEADYDANEDLLAFDQIAHLMIVTVRLTDQATDCITDPLRKFRQAQPHRKVLLAISCLHDAYPGKQHPTPDPFDQLPPDQFNSFEMQTQTREQLEKEFPDDLVVAMEAKLKLFEGLVDAWVPIDLTGEGSGFDDEAFGSSRLKHQILHLLPSAYRQSLLQMDQLDRSLIKAHQQRCAPVILSHSFLAASAAAIPIPWADIPVVLAIQSRLAYKLAAMNRQPLDRKTLTRVSATIGGQLALQMSVRGLLKVIPWVGMAVNSAAIFTYTYASGWAWNWYFTKVSSGYLPTDEELRNVYAEQLKKGEMFWKRSKENESM